MLTTSPCALAVRPRPRECRLTTRCPSPCLPRQGALADQLLNVSQVDGLILLMNVSLPRPHLPPTTQPLTLCPLLRRTQGDESRPVNIGNDAEFTILEFAEAVREVVEKVQKEKGVFKSRVNIVHKEVRRPGSQHAIKEGLEADAHFSLAPSRSRPTTPCAAAPTRRVPRSVLSRLRGGSRPCAPRADPASRLCFPPISHRRPFAGSPTSPSSPVSRRWSGTSSPGPVIADCARASG